MRNRDVLLALVPLVQPNLRIHKRGSLPAVPPGEVMAQEATLAGLANIAEQISRPPYDSQVALAELQQRDSGWIPYQAEDEMLDDKPITSFMLMKDKRYVGTVRHVSHALRQGYMASAFGLGTLNEATADGAYQPLPLGEAASLVEQASQIIN